MPNSLSRSMFLPPSEKVGKVVPAQGTTLSPQIKTFVISEDILLYLGRVWLYTNPNNWYITLNTMDHTYACVTL